MRNLSKRIWDILNGPANQFVELGYGWMLLCWGLWILNPWMHTFDNSNLYSTLIMLAEKARSPMDAETTWGTIGFLVGLNQFVAVLRGHPHAREAACLMAILFFSFMALNFQISLPTSPSTVWFAGFVAFEIFAMLRIERT